MELQRNLVLITVVFWVTYISPRMSAPIAAPLEDDMMTTTEEAIDLTDTVFDLIQDKDNDVSDQVDNIVSLAETLMEMGYMEQKVHFSAEDLDKTEMNTQIAEFQHNAGIKVTGTITASTMVAVKSPRCGITPDVTNTTESSEEGNERRRKRFAIAGSRNKWPQNRISWRIGSWPTSGKISQRQVLKDIRAAFKTWSDVTPLEFVEVNNEEASDVDIRIEFMKKKHTTDSREPPFDGRGGTLAHAFYPNSGWQEVDGDIHFDDDEVFTYKDKEFGTNLFYTAAHEIGHSLGLQHSSNPEALMNPWDKGYVKNFQLPKDDELGIQTIYGINPNLRPGEGGGTAATASTTPEPVLTTETVAHGDCENAKIAVTIIDGSLFVFQGEHLWRYQGEHVNQRLLTPLHGFPIRRYFKDGPKSIDAAFTYKNGSAVFIRGKNMWVFDIRTRRMVGEPGLYPMRISRVFGIPRDLDGAFHDNRNGVAYFFKDDQLWKYNTNRNKLITKNSILAREEFTNLPSHISGAYSDIHGHRYVIKDQKYWQYNEGDNNVTAGYPKMFAFLDCH